MGLLFGSWAASFRGPWLCVPASPQVCLFVEHCCDSLRQVVSSSLGLVTALSSTTTAVEGWVRGPHNEPVAQKEEHLVSFLLRTIRIGINATWLVVTGLAFYLMFSSGDGIDQRRFLIVLLVALAGALSVALLPWTRLLPTKWGWPALYAWSALDIVLITVLIDASGAERSVLFVMYGLTTVFFSASYPRVAQWSLFAFTFVCYVGVGLASGWNMEMGSFILRLAVLGSLMYIVSYLSSALIAQNAELERRAERQRQTSEQLLEVQKLARLGSWTYHPDDGDFTSVTILGSALDITERKRAEEYDAKLRDLKANRSQALQINDNIVQGLTVAKYALEMGRLDIAAEALETTLTGAKEIIGGLLSDGVEGGALLRSEPAILHRRDAADTDDEPTSASTA